MVSEEIQYILEDKYDRASKVGKRLINFVLSYERRLTVTAFNTIRLLPCEVRMIVEDEFNLRLKSEPKLSSPYDYYEIVKPEVDDLNLPCGLAFRDFPKCAHGNKCCNGFKCQAAKRFEEELRIRNYELGINNILGRGYGKNQISRSAGL